MGREVEGWEGGSHSGELVVQAPLTLIRKVIRVQHRKVTLPVAEAGVKEASRS